MFDLSTIVEQQTAEVELLHPVTRIPLGAIILVAGPEHPKRKKLNFDVQRKLRAAFARKGKFEASDPEDDEAESIATLAALTLGWKGMARDGKELPYSPEAAQQLYADPNLAWLRIQVRQALDDRENFIGGSAPA